MVRGVSSRKQGEEGEGPEGSERTCLVTRAKLAPEDLLRFVLAPDGAVVPDLRRKLPGRGAWVQASRDAVAEAVRRKAFTRAFKAPAQAGGDLADLVDALLVKDALQSLSMANKAGFVLAGAFKVEQEIAQRAPAALIEARDGSPDGARKMVAALFRRWPEAAAETPRVELFDSGQLDLALGRTNVIHAALRKGAASDAFLARCRRLARYRAGGLAEAAPQDSVPQADSSGESADEQNNQPARERGSE